MGAWEITKKDLRLILKDKGRCTRCWRFPWYLSPSSEYRPDNSLRDTISQSW